MGAHHSVSDKISSLDSSSASLIPILDSEQNFMTNSAGISAPSHLCCEGMNSANIGCHRDSTNFVPVDVVHAGNLDAKVLEPDTGLADRDCVQRHEIHSGGSSQHLQHGEYALPLLASGVDGASMVSQVGMNHQSPHRNVSNVPNWTAVESNALRGSVEPNLVQNIDGHVALALSSSHCELTPLHSFENRCAWVPSGPMLSGPMTPVSAQLDERFHALDSPSVSPQCDVLNGPGLVPGNVNSVPGNVNSVTDGNALLPCNLRSEMVCEAVVGSGVGSSSNPPHPDGDAADLGLLFVVCADALAKLLLPLHLYLHSAVCPLIRRRQTKFALAVSCGEVKECCLQVGCAEEPWRIDFGYCP
ncbi:hypothetical protein Nepgr_023929 [Nepenthes gracilis]|uniref:Uncharacterized protein n=1 Tax=Nepenthes gracilis TaxID=150966 RepID=A0AAD3T572_NEPGR|nr:hypothetical protein Nepgr_023929 [Nepenthes gracilis]